MSVLLISFWHGVSLVLASEHGGNVSKAKTNQRLRTALRDELTHYLYQPSFLFWIVIYFFSSFSIKLDSPTIRPSSAASTMVLVSRVR